LKVQIASDRIGVSLAETTSMMTLSTATFLLLVSGITGGISGVLLFLSACVR
jgi:hypothetical protein